MQNNAGPAGYPILIEQLPRLVMLPGEPLRIQFPQAFGEVISVSAEGVEVLGHGEGLEFVPALVAFEVMPEEPEPEPPGILPPEGMPQA